MGIDDTSTSNAGNTASESRSVISDGGRLKLAQPTKTEDDIREELLEACKHSRLSVIKKVVAQKKVELKTCVANNSHRDPPLHFAAYHGHKRIVKYLIEEGFDVESKNHYENTPLHRAARQGHLKVVKYLVEEKRSDPMAVCVWSRTPLHNACKTGQLEVVKYLMNDRRVDRSAKDSVRKQTPLQLAAEYGTVEVVQYMMDNGVDSEEPGPYTLLHLAAYGGKLDIVQYFIQKRKYDPMKKDKDENTLLHSACVTGRLEVVKYLVEVCEVEISNCDNRYQESPLGSAAKFGQMKVVKYLVEERNCIIEHGINNQNTALHSAAWGGALNVVKYFIDKRKCNPACKGKKHRTPLHTACYSDTREVVDYLIDQHNVEVSCRDHDGATPLHLAAKGGHLPLVKQLVRNHKCDHASRDILGKTPLDYASKANRDTTVTYLSLVREITSAQELPPQTECEEILHNLETMVVDIDDLFDVKSELEPVVDRWKHIGLALGLTPDQVKRIERENRDIEDCLTEVLTLWLKRNYNTERFGEPSWEMLARAVGHRSGGNNPALAREIGRTYNRGVDPSSVMASTYTPTQSREPDRNPTKTDSGRAFPVIRGADIVARTTVEITPDQPLSFHWEGHGFRVYIPAGAVSRRVTLCIQASLSGDYQLPDDGALVSGVYWLSLHPHIEEFQKKVTLSLQHCASVEGDESLSFISAKCTQETLPYTFKPLPGGAFSTNDGTIQVPSFSGFSLFQKNSRKMYNFRVYYIPCKHLNECDVHVTLTPNLELHRTRVMEEYENKEAGLTFIAKINEDRVSLRIPSEKDGWKLRAFKSLELQKEFVDNYKPGREIPNFPFRVKLIDVENPRPLWAEVNLDGVEKERYLIVARDPDKPTPVPPETREPPEITVLNTNREFIIDAVSVGDTLQWFADCLVAKAFIADKTAQGILSIHGITAAEKASQLMNSVFAKLRVSDNKSRCFNEFVDIFSHDRAYAELVERLRKEA